MESTNNLHQNSMAFYRVYNTVVAVMSGTKRFSSFVKCFAFGIVCASELYVCIIQYTGAF